MLTQVQTLKSPAPAIANFQSAREFLNEYFQWSKSRNKGISLRAWARMMGMRDHSLLVLLLNGRRAIRHQHIEFLLRGLRISELEKRRFKLLVQADNAEDEEERLILLKSLSSQESVELKLEEFRLISHWLHFALLEMTELKDFRMDLDWIASRLEPPTTRADISAAWSRLVRMGLVKEVQGRWKKVNRALTTRGDVSSQAVRAHHRQILELAQNAVDAQTLEERVLNSCTMTIAKKNLPLAEQLIVEFRNKFESLLEVAEGDATYQLSVQFFRLTRDLDKRKNKLEGKTK